MFPSYYLIYRKGNKPQLHSEKRGMPCKRVGPLLGINASALWPKAMRYNL